MGLGLGNFGRAIEAICKHGVSRMATRNTALNCWLVRMNKENQGDVETKSRIRTYGFDVGAADVAADVHEGALVGTEGEFVQHGEPGSRKQPQQVGVLAEHLPW